jgi:tetratricopeptide (TPR) repeat protein
MLYFQNKDYDAAIQAWDSTITLNPSNADAHNNLGVCYQNYKKDNKKAQEYFTNSVKLNPDYTQGYYNLLICAQNNSDKKSLVTYTKILLHKGASINDIKARGISISDDLMKLITAP